MIAISYQSKFLFCLLILATCGAWGKESPVEPEPYKKTLEEKFIDSNIAISNWFNSVAEGIDLFLMGKKRITDERNQTYVRVENSSYSSEGSGVTNVTNLAASLRFPNFEKYWNLKFTTYDEQEEKRGVDKGYLRQSARQKNYGATVGFFRKFGQIRTAFQPRIELQDPLRVSHSLSFESVADFVKYRINPKLEFFASATRGTGIFQAINFNFPLNDNFTLTVINEGDYEDRTHKYAVTNGLSFGHYLSDRNSLAYNLMFYSINQPVYHLQGYSPSVSWYHLLYKNILDIQLTPHVDFNEDNNFKGVAGLVFQINLNF